MRSFLVIIKKEEEIAEKEKELESKL